MLAHKMIAFDMETAKILPESVRDILTHRPLGIIVAAAILSDTGKELCWCAGGRESPTDRMTRAEAQGVVRDLVGFVDSGYSLLTWNGLGFDFDILAEESGMLAECRHLAINHYDMMFEIFCHKGYPLGLQSVARGFGLGGKHEGISGFQAPILWAQGEHKKVMDYATQDVRLALDVYRQACREKQVRWLSQKGKPQVLKLSAGFHKVHEVIAMPEPDTSWMSEPIPRSKFTGWLGNKRA